MNAAYVSTVGDLRQLCIPARLATLIQLIQQGFVEVYNQEPSADELTAWTRSLPAFISQLPPSCDGLPLLIEQRMPIGNERADVVLLGGDSVRRAAVVELKHWSGCVESYLPSPNLVLLGGEGGLLRPHPAYQTDGYVGKLGHYHGIGQEYEIDGVVYLHEISSSEPLRQMMDGYSSRVFFQDDSAKLGDFLVSRLVPCSRTILDAQSFADGEYTVSARLVEFVSANKDAIKARIYAALAASGFSLCEEQALAVGEIMTAAFAATHARTRGETPPRICFVVNGPPGSGKTLVALTTLVESLGTGIRALYGLRRNGALVNTLRRALRGDLEGSIYFLNVPRTNRGILDAGFRGTNLDLLICDEAQRMLKDSLPVALSRAPVIVFLVDETQRLNMDEQGVENNFRKAAAQTNFPFKVLPSLPAGVRCRGGIPYHSFVERLLTAPDQLHPGCLRNPPWRNSYRFEVFEDYRAFKAALAQLRDNLKMKVAIVASWTESDGDSTWRLTMRPRTTHKNIRIGPQLQSGNELYPQGTEEVSWVMNPDDYRTFWSGVSSDLDICASIYGSQGFETDAVGFVWGRDLVWDIDGGAWVLGGRNTSCDYSGGTQRQMSIKNLMNQIASEVTHPLYDEVKTLLLNRARIFLTRGILATLVYVEDEPTRSFLRALA